MVWPGFMERRVSCDAERILVDVCFVAEDGKVFGQEAVEV
jgi:hypothetical protein